MDIHIYICIYITVEEEERKEKPCKETAYVYTWTPYVQKAVTLPAISLHSKAMILSSYYYSVHIL